MTFDQLPSAIEELQTMVRVILEKNSVAESLSEWMTLKQAAELKFGPGGYDSLRNLDRRYYPNFGESHAVLHGGRYSRAYRRDEVLAWLSLTAEEIDRLYEERLRSESAEMARVTR